MYGLLYQLKGCPRCMGDMVFDEVTGNAGNAAIITTREASAWKTLLLPNNKRTYKIHALQIIQFLRPNPPAHPRKTARQKSVEGVMVLVLRKTSTL